MITWEPSTSVIVAPARLAIERMTSLPAALSPVATTAQEGKVFQAGTPVVQGDGHSTQHARRPPLHLAQGSEARANLL